MSAAEKTNGGANRILWLYVRRSKQLPFGGDPWTPELEALVPKLQYAVPRPELAGEIGMEDDARAAWPPIYARLTTPRPGPAGEMLARGAPIVRRLAAVYALADDRLNVRLSDVHAAVALWDYACRSVVHTFGSSTGSPDADRIVNALATAPQRLDAHRHHRAGVPAEPDQGANRRRPDPVAGQRLGALHPNKNGRGGGRTMVLRPAGHELNEPGEFVRFVLFSCRGQHPNPETTNMTATLHQPPAEVPPDDPLSRLPQPTGMNAAIRSVA